jgi:N-methylhydantoinase B/oxoprolinase/acetone carboxylase alpha subunit
MTTPVEIFETRYPFVEWSYRLRGDSGGPGRHRGGLGSERILEVRAPEITVSALFDRMTSKPWGLFGGNGAETSRLLVKKAGEEDFVAFREAFGTPSNSRVANIKLQAGDQVMLCSPGGGGFGPPVERQPESVLQDVQEGFVSDEEALATYAVAIDVENGAQQVDWKETERLRR